MKLFTKVILPLLGLAIWLWISYALAEGFSDTEGPSLLLWWIVAGCPFGLMHMRHILVPTGHADLALTAIIWLLDLIIGGLIGGAVIVSKLVKILANIVRFATHQEMV